jgi:hypothetical protein
MSGGNDGEGSMMEKRGFRSEDGKHNFFNHVLKSKDLLKYPLSRKLAKT